MSAFTSWKRGTRQRHRNGGGGRAAYRGKAMSSALLEPGGGLSEE